MFCLWVKSSHIFISLWSKSLPITKIHMDLLKQLRKHNIKLHKHAVLFNERCTVLLLKWVTSPFSSINTTRYQNLPHAYVSICKRLRKNNFMSRYTKTYISSRSQPHKASAILSGSPRLLSILIQCNINPHSRCHTNAHVQCWQKMHILRVVHTWFDFILFICSECSRHYWVTATPHACLLFFGFTHTYTRTQKTHQSAQHGTRWGSLKSQSHTCSPTHHVHIHTCTHVLALILSLLSRGDFILNWQSQKKYQE